LLLIACHRSGKTKMTHISREKSVIYAHRYGNGTDAPVERRNRRPRDEFAVAATDFYYEAGCGPNARSGPGRP